MDQATFDALSTRHGAPGKPAILDPTISELDPDQQVKNPGQKRTVPNPNPKKLYTFADGTQITLRNSDPDENGQATYEVTGASTAMNTDRAAAAKAAKPGAAAKPQATSVETLNVHNPNYVEIVDGVATVKPTPGYDASKEPAARPSIHTVGKTMYVLDPNGQIISTTTDPLDAEAARSKIDVDQANVAVAQGQLALNTKLAEGKTAVDKAHADYIAGPGTDLATQKIASDKLRDSLAQISLDMKQAQDTFSNSLSTQKAATDAQAKADLAKYNNERNRVTDAHNNRVDTETERHNKDTDLVAQRGATTNAANDDLNALNSAAGTGAGLLNTRANNAASSLNSWIGNLTSKNTNIGLGSSLGSDFGTNLTGGIQQWATDGVGGQAVVDAAKASVAAIDPASAAAAGPHATLARMQQLMTQQGMPLHPAVQQDVATPLTGNAPSLAAPVLPGQSIPAPTFNANAAGSSLTGGERTGGTGIRDTTGNPTDNQVEQYADQQTQAGTPTNWTDARTYLNSLGVAPVAPVARIAPVGFSPPQNAMAGR